MAWLQIDFFSECMQMNVPVNVVVPAESINYGGTPFDLAPYKVLYLLHGYQDSASGWLLSTRISQFAHQFGMAIIMPSGMNGFYTDNPALRKRDGEYIWRELVEFTRKLLPISEKREDTIIAGVSMGGYGAMRNGLLHGDVFGHTIALSPPFYGVFAEASEEPATDGIILGITRHYYETVLGCRVEDMRSCDIDPEFLAKKVLDENLPMTDFYLACGYNDKLVPYNRRFHEYLTEIGFPHVYEEGEGTHGWRFWESRLLRALQRIMPVKKQYSNPFWVENDMYDLQRGLK